MWKCKTKDIQPYLDIQAYSAIFRNYSDIFWNLCNPGIFRTLAYSKPETYWEAWHIQNQRHIEKPGVSKTLAHSEPETYSEFWAIQNPEILRTRGILWTLPNIYNGAFGETANGYNYFCKSIIFAISAFLAL